MIRKQHIITTIPYDCDLRALMMKRKGLKEEKRTESLHRGAAKNKLRELMSCMRFASCTLYRIYKMLILAFVLFSQFAGGIIICPMQTYDGSCGQTLGNT